MGKRELSELEIRAAFQAFLADAPTEVQPAVLVDQLAQTQQGGRLSRTWRSILVPPAGRSPALRLAWLVALLGLLLAATVSAVYVGSELLRRADELADLQPPPAIMIAEVTPSAAAETQPGVTVERHVPFATYDGTTLTLDLWLPPDPSGVPILIGPWGEANAFDIAQAGAIVVDIRTGVPDPPDNDDDGVRFLSDHGAFVRAQAEAGACTIRFAKARAAELGSDDPIVVLSGGGPAAHVALFGATLEERWDEFAAAVGGPPRQVECLVADGSTHVDALVGTVGAYDLYVPAIEGVYGRTYQQAFDPELQQFLASAIGVDPAVVVRLFRGTDDPVIPTTVSEDFAAVLADAGYDVQYTFGGQHTAPSTELGLPVFEELLGL